MINKHRCSIINLYRIWDNTWKCYILFLFFSVQYHVAYKYQATNFKASLKQKNLKHTYSSVKSSCSKVAATIYERGMGLSFCKKFTYWKKWENQTLTITSWLKNIQKTATGQGDNYTTGCLLAYPNIKEYYMMTAIDLSKKQVFDADPKVIQRIYFTENLQSFS